MGTADQRFNVDVAFLLGTNWTSGSVREKEREIKDSRSPNWDTAYTDWNRRAIRLPKIQKSVENWSGKLQSSDVEIDLYDGDGSVYSTLGSGGMAFGKQVGIYSKITENPDYWIPVFSGNITGISRSKSLTTVKFADSMRNLYNSQFVRDYYCAATNIGGLLYGTVRDVFGTNIYIDDRGQVTQIRRETKDEGGGWLGAIFSGAVGAILGAIKGGLVGAAIGGLSGVLGGIPKTASAGQYYYRVDDYNTIPDDLIFGGQKLKFHTGSVDPRARNAGGALYSSPAYTVKGGTFATAIYGTVEIGDVYHSIRKGDTLYVELPLVFYGSPDEVIVNMLCGSNCTAPFNYPLDFSPNWISSAEPLKHIECWNFVESTDIGGVSDEITKLCSEFGFTFYLDERNRFAIRTVRNVDINADAIIGTLDERYNVIDDGFSISEDINDSYTDITLRYKPFGDNSFEGEIRATTLAATYFGGIRRALTIDSEWIHDEMTGEFIATRLMRRYATAIKRAEANVSLFSVPVGLGEMVKCTGWAIGTNTTYEIIGYEKDFHANRCSVTLEHAEPLYQSQRYGYFSTSYGTLSEGCYSGWATVLCNKTGTFGNAGTIKGPISNSQSEVALYFLATPGNDPFNVYGSVTNIEGSYFRIGTRGEEILKAFRGAVYSTLISGQTWLVNEWRVERGCFNTRPDEYVSPEMAAPMDTWWATVFGGAGTNGTYFRWF